MMLVKKKLLKVLQDISNDPKKSWCICLRVATELEEETVKTRIAVQNILRDYFKSWEYYSGDVILPVEGDQAIKNYLMNEIEEKFDGSKN